MVVARGLCSIVPLPHLLLKLLSNANSKATRYAPIYQLNWESSDLPITINSIAPATASNARNSPSRRASTTPPTSQHDKARIGVGAAMVALAVISAMAWIVLRYRRSNLPAQLRELHCQEKYDMEIHRSSGLLHGTERLRTEIYRISGRSTAALRDGHRMIGIEKACGCECNELNSEFFSFLHIWASKIWNWTFSYKRMQDNLLPIRQQFGHLHDHGHPSRQACMRLHSQSPPFTLSQTSLFRAKAHPTTRTPSSLTHTSRFSKTLWSFL